MSNQCPFIEHYGTEFVLVDELDESGHDRGDLLIRDELEDLRLDAVDAGELMGAWGVAE